jgi:preprotein translocase subunit SecB
MAKKKTPEVAAETPPAAPEDASDGAPGMRILAQFVRDISFENPRAPASLVGEPSSLKVDRHIEISARGREDGLFEVDLKLVCQASRDGQPVFLADVVYGGLFGLDNIPEQEISPILAVDCPRFLFPFVRQVVANLVSDGGFPPFRIDPIDFGAIYMARQQDIAAQQAAQGGGHSLNG